MELKNYRTQIDTKIKNNLIALEKSSDISREIQENRVELLRLNKILLSLKGNGNYAEEKQSKIGEN